MPGQSSSLPMNTSAASECCRTWRTESAVRFGYSGTETCPAIQIARSAMIQCAQFLEMIAMRLPCGSSRPRSQLALRLACSPTSAQLNVCS
ncbi:hypothetical protein D3C86_1740040 [compost metagenome]